MPPSRRTNVATGANPGNTGFQLLPPGTPGFDDTHSYLYLAKDAPVARSLLFLPWLPLPNANANLAPTEVAISESLLVAAIAAGARIASNPQAITAWSDADVLTHNISLSAINSMVTFLEGCGLFAVSHTDFEVYRSSYTSTLRSNVLDPAVCVSTGQQ